jgi:hypothetical protein
MLRLLASSVPLPMLPCLLLSLSMRWNDRKLRIRRRVYKTKAIDCYILTLLFFGMPLLETVETVEIAPIFALKRWFWVLLVIIYIFGLDLLHRHGLGIKVKVFRASSDSRQWLVHWYWMSHCSCQRYNIILDSYGVFVKNLICFSLPFELKLPFM